MPALFFPNLNALRLALVSGLVPRQVSSASAVAGFDSHGRLWLEPSETPTRETLAALARIGVQTLGGIGVRTSPVSCWAELLPLIPSPEQPHGPILFLAPDRLLARLVARIRRANSGPVGVKLPETGLADQGLVTATSAPPDLLAETLEEKASIESFAEQVPGLWVRRGWRHPTAEHLHIPTGRILLVRPPRSVLAVEGGVASSESDQFALRPIPVPRLNEPGRALAIPVAIRLSVRGSRRRESLWVLDKSDAAAFWQFCASADDRVIGRLEAARVRNGATERLIVRSRGKKHVPVLPLSIAGYAPDPNVPGLFVPADRQLRPVLRTSELATTLALRKGRLVWLEPAARGALVSHAIEETAFRPLPELIEYIRPEGTLLQTAPRAELFPLGRFVPAAAQLPILDLDEEDLIPEHESETAPAPAASEGRSRWLVRSYRDLAARFRQSVRNLIHRRPATRQNAERPPVPPVESPVPQADERGKHVERSLGSPEALLHGYDWAARRRELEARLFADLPRLGPAGRAERWADLAGVYSATANAQDAAVCWMNAVWESPSPPPDWLEHWLADECRAAKLPVGEASLERWLSEPGRAGVGRVVAAYTAMVGFGSNPRPEFISSLPRILSFLDQHFDDLPTRAAWFARLAATRVCEGDALGLARWRDRVLARLADRGPGLDLDEPSFLRFHGTASAERFQTAREWLVHVRHSALAWVQEQGKGGRLRWAGLDAETEATTAYAQFMFAWALGCLGERTRAKDWAAKARKLVSRAGGPGVDPAAHAVLGDLFLLRVKDAQEGRPAKPGLPTDLAVRIDALPELARYSVDRLREHSRILEPLDRVRAFRGLDLKSFWGNDRLGERLSVLAARTEPDLLAEEAHSLIEMCGSSPGTSILPRIVLTLLEVSPRLELTAFLQLLDMVPDALAWTEAWLAALPGGDERRSQSLVNYQSRILDSVFAAAGKRESAAVAPAMGILARKTLTSVESLRQPLLNVSGTVFRALARLSLHAEAEQLVAALDLRTPEEAAMPSIVARLGLAIGWYVAGNEKQGDEYVNEARKVLYRSGSLTQSGRTALAIAYADALAFVPPRIAHGRLEEIFQLLKGVKTMGSTNPYFTLPPLQLVDTVVRSVVTDDFALGPQVRGWLDDDEFLIRGRIHRDLATVLREQGIA
ncbi:MAG TPA: hypothetical protein VLM40_00490 [Gemmata sp.]|nr:hypothetical protein [Gemmata sp.]